MDLDSGYWQIEAEESARPKLAFFTPSGKKTWTVMPMGATNAHPVFVALVSKMKKECNTLADKDGLKDYGSKVIVDNIIAYACDPQTLLKYFVCILKVLKHYRCTVKLCKCRFFQPVTQSIGVDLHANENNPAASKLAASTATRTSLMH